MTKEELEAEFQEFGFRFPMDWYTFSGAVSDAYHKITKQWPGSKKEFITRYNVYRDGEVVARGVDNQTACTITGVKEAFEDHNLLDGWNVRMKSYSEKTQKLHSLFERGLAYYFGVENNPKSGMLFSKAWDRGHSGGYQEVANVYSDLVELIE